MSGGKLIVATAHLYEEASLAGLREIWDEFAQWQKEVMPALPEEERLFYTKMKGLTVWVIEDGAAFTPHVSRGLLSLLRVCLPSGDVSGVSTAVGA